ncbi:hypothetical protein FOL47_001409 [Perkinsus chesapeaki]|uniref:D-serine dehydratase-like domain-containing protein n=1 Tax=Perkinsus chesapeaki TaxID=330153 RepID=A0A7J6MJD0_PERCH|nr:hypothetical protein FOL47_001409 [Perkinsus chesapeaki]
MPPKAQAKPAEHSDKEIHEGNEGVESEDDEGVSVSSMSPSEEQELMLSEAQLKESEPIHFSNIDGDDNIEGVDMTTFSGGLPRIYHHTQIGQCLVDVLHELMSEGKASLQDKEKALKILEEEFDLAFRSIHPEVMDSRAKEDKQQQQAKGKRKRKRKAGDEGEDDDNDAMDQDILALLRDDPLFSREDGESEDAANGGSVGVRAQRSQSSRMAMERAATTSYSTGAWHFTGSFDEFGGLRECQALQCSHLLRGSKAEMKSPLVQLKFDEIEVRVADPVEKEQPRTRLHALGRHLSRIETPRLVVMESAFAYNREKMDHIFNSHENLLKCNFRPHAKAHKSPAIARIQLEDGAVGFSCQTLTEAETCVKGGAKDILISNEPQLQPESLQRLVDIASRVDSLKVCVDHPHQVACLSAAVMQYNPKTKIECVIDVDVGQGRCGLSTPAEAVTLAQSVLSLEGQGVTFRGGIQAYHGGIQQIRDPVDRKSESDVVVQIVEEVRREFNKAGLEINSVTGGGTGSFTMEGNSGQFTEVQPGSYLFMDADYCANHDAIFKPSLFVLASIISIGDGRLVLDVGTKGMDYSCIKSPVFYGSVPNGRGPVEVSPYFGAAGGAAKGISVSCAGDEHTVLKGSNESLKALVGERHCERPGGAVLIQPAHCDPTVNMYDNMLYVDDENATVKDIWEINRAAELLNVCCFVVGWQGDDVQVSYGFMFMRSHLLFSPASKASADEEEDVVVPDSVVCLFADLRSAAIAVVSKIDSSKSSTPEAVQTVCHVMGQARTCRRIASLLLLAYDELLGISPRDEVWGMRRQAQWVDSLLQVSAEGQTLHGAVGIIRNALDELQFALGDSDDNDGTNELLEQVGRQLVGDAAMLSSYSARVKIHAGAVSIVLGFVPNKETLTLVEKRIGQIYEARDTTAESVLKRKHLPIKLVNNTPSTLKVCLFKSTDKVCMFPVEEGTQTLVPGGVAEVRPICPTLDSFWARVYYPRTPMDRQAHSGARIVRGENLVIDGMGAGNISVTVETNLNKEQSGSGGDEGKPGRKGEYRVDYEASEH